MHATETQWYIVVCYDKLSVQQCLCIYTAIELNLKGGFCRNPRNPSGSATVNSSGTSDMNNEIVLWKILYMACYYNHFVQCPSRDRTVL